MRIAQARLLLCALPPPTENPSPTRWRQSSLPLHDPSSLTLPHSPHPAITHAANRTTWAAAVSSVDLVLTDEFGTAASRTAKDVAFAATTDPGILNRAEWVKFLSLFFNAEPAVR